MSTRGRQFFDEWVAAKFDGFNPPHLQNEVAANTRYLLAEAKQMGIQEFEIEAEVGGSVHQAVFDAMMKALEPR